MTVLVELAGESAGYSGPPVLHDIDLTIRAGERVAVMGRSGASAHVIISNAGLSWLIETRAIRDRGHAFHAPAGRHDASG